MSDIKERLTHRALQMELGDFCADLLIAAGMIDELEEHNKELLELLELALAAYNRLLASDSLKAAWTFGGFEAKARAAIAKAKGEE